ncbi:MAG: PRC-barrel domain-containing protein [Candidatus Micrarchaeia archaeon]
MRISKLYNMDIFTDTGKFLGRVQDMVVDFEKGEIVRITMEPLNAASKEEAKRILREKSVLYKNVKSVEDVVVVTKGTTPPLSESELEEEKGAGFRFGR